MSEKTTFIIILNNGDAYTLRIYNLDKITEYTLTQAQVRELGVDALHALDSRLYKIETALSSNTAASIGDDNGRQAPPTDSPCPTASEAGH